MDSLDMCLSLALQHLGMDYAPPSGPREIPGRNCETGLAATGLGLRPRPAWLVGRIGPVSSGPGLAHFRRRSTWGGCYVA